MVQAEINARNRCLSPEEEARLLEALPPRFRPIVIIALHTGMRRGELRALRWQDVDFPTGAIHVRQDKAGEGRWAALNSVARETLLAIKRDQKVLSPYVFCSPEGKFLHNFERYFTPPRSLTSDSTTFGTPSRAASPWMAWTCIRSSGPAGGRPSSWFSDMRT